jgi:hypothetical protein
VPALGGLEVPRTLRARAQADRVDSALVLQDEPMISLSPCRARPLWASTTKLTWQVEGPQGSASGFPTRIEAPVKTSTQWCWRLGTFWRQRIRLRAESAIACLPPVVPRLLASTSLDPMRGLNR